MTKRRRIVIPVLLVLAALVAALLLLSKYGLSVTRLSLEFDDLPRGFDGFKIVQLSDLHGSEFGRDNARLIKAVAEEEPDIIALTGDFLDEGKAGQELPALEALVKELVKLAPVYFVSGNHDWASGAAPELFETLGAAGVNCLRNDFVYLERGGDVLVLGGVDDPNGPADMETPDEFISRLRSEAPGAFTLLLARLLGGALCGPRRGPHPLRPHPWRHSPPPLPRRRGGHELRPLPRIRRRALRDGVLQALHLPRPRQLRAAPPLSQHARARIHHSQVRVSAPTGALFFTCLQQTALWL